MNYYFSDVCVIYEALRGAGDWALNVNLSPASQFPLDSLHSPGQRILSKYLPSIFTFASTSVDFVTSVYVSSTYQQRS